MLCGLMVLTGFSQSSLYQLSVTGVNHQSYPLSSFQGRKIWVVVLPATRTAADSAYLSRVDSVTLANHAGLSTIVVPSYEDGFAGDSTGLLAWYQSALNSSIVISQPLYTHKTSAGQQDPLFQWLTKVEGNTHFDADVEGACESFFIDGSGVLYSVFSPDARFSNKALNYVLP
jgi:glutathione peroxidase-family protein